MSTARRLIAIALFFVVCTLPSRGQDVVRYDDWHQIRIEPTSPQQIELLHELGAIPLSDYVGLRLMDYVVPPEALDVLLDAGLPLDVIDTDIQRWIDAERARLAKAPRVDPRDETWFEDYKTFDQIVAKLQAHATDRPDLVTLIDIGDSIEGRDLWCVRISGPGTDKPAVLFNGTQHAREWISPMVTMWIVDKLVSEYDTDPTIQSLVDRVEFFIVPVVNPDGYIYSWQSDRLWRKNRRDNAGTSCMGVDLNRNWDAGWGGAGASGNPCDITYYGSSPLSEPETQALANFALTHPNIVAHVDYHSYSQLILSPFGYKSDLPPEHNTFMALNEAMHDEILAVHGEQYDYGPIYHSIYPASGGATDWSYETAGNYAFTIELRDRGTYGFELPPDQIIPTCEENFPAAMYLSEWSSTPLKISLPAGQPAWIEPNQPYTLAVQIDEITATVQAGTAELRYRTSAGGTFATSPLVDLGGGAYDATLPATSCGATVEYFIEVDTTDGQTITEPPEGAAAAYTTEVLPRITILVDDMETDMGWTVGAPGDTATTGIWNRMAPQATDAQPGDDHSPAPGTMCWVTDGRSGTSVGTYDVDDGPTSLISPVFDAGGLDAHVSYWRWYSNDEGSSPNADVFTVQISGDAGDTWVDVEVVGPTGAEASGGWYAHRFFISDVTTPTAAMRLKFIADDGGYGSIVEAAIDDLVIEAPGTCPNNLPGDCDCDGDVDYFDIQYFLAALEGEVEWRALYDAQHGGEPPCPYSNSDVDGDGLVDYFDIQPFVDGLGS